ncbi:DUF4760 domain-containing protein [filamentous cyanobacterium LEGE 11480]|uniref:DUF4760 domain-containing protein n=1 Tax=Romeriopsis navalis LEGE 11480 TaxID=2777977 RepID=A0A928VU70_9CYAN|nr:DUF4760 domain-containing protein [Romeriopsis navalis]MBE9033146.1 DUF4760 domain-containing protein [Romeriopsis navalis LEGE 11480]
MNNIQNPDEIRQFNVRIVIGFASIAATIATVLTVAFVITNEERVRKNLTFGATAISMAAGVAGAAYGLQSLRQNNLQQKENRRIDATRAYIDRWDEPQFAQARITIRELSQTVNSAVSNKSEQLRDRIKQKPTAQQDVTLILNLLEKIALFWDAGLLYEPLLKQFYCPIVLQSWDVLKVYVADRRNEVDVELYKSVEKLYITWSRDP